MVVPRGERFRDADGPIYGVVDGADEVGGLGWSGWHALYGEELRSVDDDESEVVQVVLIKDAGVLPGGRNQSTATSRSIFTSQFTAMMDTNIGSNLSLTPFYLSVGVKSLTMQRAYSAGTSRLHHDAESRVCE